MNSRRLRHWAGFGLSVLGGLLLILWVRGSVDAAESPLRRRPSAAVRTANTRLGVFIQTAAGQKPLLPHETIIKTSKKRKVASFLVPSIKEKKMVVVEGPRAPVRIRARKPVLHINLPDARSSQFMLLRLHPKGSFREVTEVRVLAIRQDVEKKEELVFSKVRGYNDHEYTLTPTEPLTPGEYGLVKLPKLNPFTNKQVAVGKIIWDFGVDAPNQPK